MAGQVAISGQVNLIDGGLAEICDINGYCRQFFMANTFEVVK
jgi:hypothetical protein